MSEGVAAIGGVFFRSKDPDALGAWYKEHFGIDCGHYWPQQGGNAVFAPFKADTDYWPAGKAFMLNFRVTDMDAMIASLENAGVEVQTQPEWDTPEYGRFARVTDPEGTPIELWEPAP